jgi:NACHT domain/Restriction endonuclease
MTPSLRHIAETTLQAFEYLNMHGAEDERRQRSADFFVLPKVANASGQLFDAQQVLEDHARVIILGAPGAGKTTLLTFHATALAHSFLDGPPSGLCPLFFRAPEIGSMSDTGTLVERIKNVICERFAMLDGFDEIHALLSSNQIALLIDGIDEIVEVSHRINLMSELDDLASQFPALRVIASSRPAGLTLVASNIRLLSPGASRDFAYRMSSQNPERAASFVQAIQSQRSLYALASNPLLLTLLWQVFQARGILPDNQTSLYSDCADFLLSTWERFKGGLRVQTSLSERHQALEVLAFELLVERATHSVTRSELHHRLKGLLEARDADSSDATVLLEELLTTGILVEESLDRVGFIHLTFLEYYSARAVSNDTSRVVRLVERPELHNVVVMACGLLLDVAPIIEAAVEKRHLLLAAKCISHGRTQNKRLADYVVASFIHEVGETFIAQLITSADRLPNEPEALSVQEDLLLLLDRTADQGLGSVDKGRLFEDFSCRFFGQCFTVVRRDYNTENGELDLVLEVTRSEPFWADYGGEVLVECKNWKTHAPLEQVAGFAHKVSLARGIRLGFFLSMGGFTEDAIRTLRNQAGDVTKPLIVPISGRDIRRALLQRDDLSEFLKDAIRDMKYLRKY